MLDSGKFSVYNGSGGAGGPPPAAVKTPSPINFKFESVQSARLSFDDELRLAMDKFHRAKEPSPTKVALKKWFSEGTSKLFAFLDKKIETAPKAPKAAKAPKEQKPSAPLFKFPALPKFDLPKIDLPKFNLPKVDLPKITLPKVDLKIEEKLEKVLEKIQHVYERVREKVEEVAEYLWEMIPHEKIAEIVHFMQKIPQNYIIPAALWVYSFIPVEAIQTSFESGVQRITRFLSTTYGFAHRGYSFCERQVKKVAAYINRTIVLPIANFLERLFRAIGQWIVEMGKKLYPLLKKAAIGLYQFTLKLPGYSWRFLKTLWRGLIRVTVWLVE